MNDPINPYDPANSDQLALFGADDRRYEKEQSRKSKPKEKPPDPLPDGPCCSNCHNWKVPEKRGEFGVCVALTMVTGTQSRRGPQKGLILDVHTALQDPTIEWEYLHTREGYGAPGDGQHACRLFEEREIAQEAA